MTVPPAVLLAVVLVQPATTAPSRCVRSDAIDRARARFESEMRTAAWDAAIADAVAAQTQPGSDAPTRALFALQHARAAQQRGSYARHDPVGVQALVVAAEPPIRAAQDACLLSDLQFLKAEIHYSQAFDQTVSWDRVRRELGDVLRVLEPLGDDERLAKALFYRGLVDQQQQRGDLGRRYFERARAIATRRHDDYQLSYLERHLAAIDDARGDLASAEARLRRSLALRETARATLFIPPAQTALADVLARRDPRSPEALALYTDAATRAGALQANRLAAAAHAAISRRLAADGDRDGAIRHAETALALARAHGQPSLVASARDARDALRR
jgi:tetratricopeptide (TPR) repeat protein